MQIDQALLVKFWIQNAVKITPQDVIGMIGEMRSKDSLYGVTVRSWGPRTHRGGVYGENMQGGCFRKGYFGSTDKAVAVPGWDTAGISCYARTCNDGHSVPVATNIREYFGAIIAEGVPLWEERGRV